MNFVAINIPPNHCPCARQDSDGSFGRIYDDMENAIFLGLHGDDDDNNNNDSFGAGISPRCDNHQETEKSRSDKGSDDAKGMLRPSSVERRDSALMVTFGWVSVCEFKPKDAPIHLNPKKMSRKFAHLPFNLSAYCKQRQTKMTHCIQFAQLQIPAHFDHGSTNDGDRQPRRPVRRSESGSAI